ncbi:DUF2628 domain-containing protein [Paenibacillus segetis]|uniref:Zinc-ribbon domain-containing protein n=1 Tax=Paenibacillus segetis TaxID=1325360 RepID=A0ABQ1YSQ0_9BACL|nr:DUF2628 domain-containing protein [Paenibacillus segetis]GGH37395.1 hypothetical protein GCM10008013_44820 [Paenibacillus segetis]
MYCYNCGTNVYEDDKFCVKCGAIVKPRQESNPDVPGFLRTTTHVDQETNEPATQNLAEDLKLFVGPRASVYARKWEENSHWNWAAFLFGGYWLLYRGMYLYLLIYIIGEALILNIASSMYPRFYFSSEMVIVLLFTNLITKIAFTAIANKLYLHHAKRKINAIKLRHPKDKETCDAKIVQAGETSLYIPIALAILPLLAAFVVMLFSFLHTYKQVNLDIQQHSQQVSR